MRRLLQMLCFGLLVIVSSYSAQAQVIKDPTEWTYEVKKTGNNEYELIFIVTLVGGWHIYAIKPGGDGTLIAPSFSYAKNAKMELVGEITETGKLITEHSEGIEELINYYSHKVKYTQKVKAKPGIIIKGTHTYQVCNDMMCLPPKDKDFSFQLN